MVDAISPESDGASSTSDGPSSSDGTKINLDGSSEAIPKDDAADPSIQACEDFAAASCARLFHCSAVVAGLLTGTREECIQDYALQCALEFAIGALPASASANVIACAHATDKVSCDDLFSNRLPPDCDIHADGAVDASCSTNQECASGLCAVSGTARCGQCALRRAAGGGCLSDDVCEPGLVCTAKACVAPQAVGSSCDESHPCGFQWGCIGGKCQVTKEGTPCMQGRETCGLVDGLWCLDGQCVKAKVGVAGDRCGIVNAAPTFCGGASVCAASANGASACLAPAADADKCDPIKGPFCAPPDRCIGNRCELPGLSTCP